ncbi:hypothetical protein AGMMS49938_06930 [Fibrobacterales bacterium]|nr:hypothetical protein AGMMS49938_06930 [Fibrobacterales bacterium]
MIFITLLTLFLLSCGSGTVECEGANCGNEPRPPVSSSSDDVSSSSSEKSSSSIFSMEINWKKTPSTSSIHGSTAITLDAFMVSSDLITQGQYKTVMGKNPAKAVKNDSLPVEGVSWFNAVEFCKKLSVLMGYADSVIRLPTEAEWEYAGNGMVLFPNENYWEWTGDCYDSVFPIGTNNPSGPVNCLPADDKVRKGFGFELSNRYGTDPYSTDIGGTGYISFRVVTRNKE